MRTRTLGDIVVLAVGCGDVSLPRAALRGVDAVTAERALGEAIERGIGLVDVARDDDSERLVGDVVRTLRARDRVVAATRIEIGWRWQPAAFRAAIDASLRATRLEPLPLVQLAIDHDLFAVREWAEIADTCAQRTKAGDVVRWGAIVERDAREAPQAADVALDEAKRIAAELAAHGFVAVQLPFSVCERREQPLFDAARAAGLAVLASRPLAGGALTGAIAPGVRLAAHDERRTWDHAALERIARGAAKLAGYVQLEPPAARATAEAREQLERNPRLPDRPCRTLAELALRFVIDRGAIAVPRLHRIEHVAPALAAAAAQPLAFDAAPLDI